MAHLSEPTSVLRFPFRGSVLFHAVSMACLVHLFGVATVQAQSDRILGRPVEEWAKILHQSSDANKRQAAAFAIGKMTGKSTVPFRELKKALGAEKDPRVREAIQFSLGDLAPSLGAIPADLELQRLLLASLADGDWGVRRSAVYTLGSLPFRDDTSFAALDKSRKDDQGEVRQNVAWALARYGKSAVPALAELLSDPQPAVRRESAQALAELAQDPDANVRFALPSLFSLCQDPDLEVRKKALLALGKIVEPKDADAADPVRAALADRDGEIRLQAALVLSNIGTKAAKDAVGVLAEMLRRGNLQQQRDSALALRNLGTFASPALGELAQALGHADAQVRQNAAFALGAVKANAEPAVPKLLDLAIQSNELPSVRVKAAVALGEIGDVPSIARAIPTILDVIQNPREHGDVRHRLIWVVFGYFRRLNEFPQVESSLTRVCSEPSSLANKQVRYHAAYLLGLLKKDQVPSQALNVLHEFLLDTTLRVYQGELSQVGSGDQEAKSGQSRVTTQLGEDGRRMALDALTVVGPAVVGKRRDIVQQLRALANDAKTDPEIRKKSQSLLADL